MEKRVYEAYLIDGDKPRGGVILECLTDAAALDLAAEYARKWKASLRLYRCPFVNESSTSSFDIWSADEMPVIADLNAAGQRQ